jgi:hypothetical protein
MSILSTAALYAGVLIVVVPVACYTIYKMVIG